MIGVKSVRQGIAWLFVGNTGSQILNFLFSIVLARLLSPRDFGMLVAIQIYTGLAGFVAGGGLGQALVQAKEVNRKDYDAVLTLQLLLGGAIYAFFFAIAPWFAEWYHAPVYSELLRVSALSFIFRPFVNLPSSIMYREMRFAPLTVINVGRLVFSSLVSISMAFLGYGVWALIVGGLAGAAFSIAALIPTARWQPGLSWDWRGWRNLARYGMLVTVGDFIVYVRGQVANLLLSKTLGPHELGLFNKAYSLSVIPQTITASVYQVTLRALAKEQDSLGLSQYMYLRSVTLVALYTWPALAALAWFALPLINLLYGPKWTDAAEPLTYLATAGPFLILEMLAGAVLAARAWLHREIPVQIVQLIITVLAAVAGLSFGLVGIALAVALASLYGAVHMSWLAAQCLRISSYRIASAMAGPAMLTISLLLLWFIMDHWLLAGQRLHVLPYVLIMLGSGVVLFSSLFLLLPIPSLAAERERWRTSVEKLVVRRG